MGKIFNWFSVRNLAGHVQHLHAVHHQWSQSNNKSSCEYSSRICSISAKRLEVEHEDMHPRKLKDLLEGDFPGKLEFSYEATPNATGFFEVTAGDKLLHSKKNGDGYVDNDAKYSNIVEGIEEMLCQCQ